MGIHIAALSQGQRANEVSYKTAPADGRKLPRDALFEHDYFIDMPPYGGDIGATARKGRCTSHGNSAIGARHHACLSKRISRRGDWGNNSR